MAYSFNYTKLNDLFESSKYSKREIAKQCGFTRPTLDGLLQGADVKISTLVAAARFFRRPVSYFFDEEPIEIREAGRDYVEKGKIEHNGPEYAGQSSIESDLRDQIAQLKSQLKDKERIITLYERGLPKLD